MSDQHVRVYYSVIEDAKFATVYPNDAHFATYVRLLMLADKFYPHPAPLPARVRRASLTELVKVGIVDLVGDDHYRIHGLAAERERRSKAGKAGAAARWPGANAMRSHSDGIPVADAEALLAEAQAEAEAKQEHSIADGIAMADRVIAEPVAREEWDVFEAYYELTGRVPRPNTPLRDWLYRLGESHGHRATSQALAIEFKANPDRRDLLSRTERRLEADAFRAEQAEKRDEKRRNAAKRAPIRIVSAEDVSEEQAAAELAAYEAEYGSAS